MPLLSPRGFPCRGVSGGLRRKRLTHPCIIPNGRSEPDYMGWEMKAYSSGRITLMTPEPDGGMYGEAGVKAFVRN